jgi:hypothetical protein
MELVVEHIGGPRRGQVDRLAAGRIVVGQANSAQVFIQDPSVAPMHLEISVSGDGLVVTDLGSTTGSRIAGRPIMGPTPAPSGTMVELGHGIALRVTLEGTPGAAPPRRAPGAGQTLIASAAQLQGGAASGYGPGAGAPPPPMGGTPPPPGGPSGTMILQPAAAPPGGAPAAAPIAPPGAQPAPAVGPVSAPPPAPASAPAPVAAPVSGSGDSSGQGVGTFAVLVIVGGLVLLGLLALFVSLVLG